MQIKAVLINHLQIDFFRLGADFISILANRRLKQNYEITNLGLGFHYQQLTVHVTNFDVTANASQKVQPIFLLRGQLIFLAFDFHKLALNEKLVSSKTIKNFPSHNLLCVRPGST